MPNPPHNPEPDLPPHPGPIQARPRGVDQGSPPGHPQFTHAPGSPPPDEYLDEPALPPRMALAPPHLDRPEAPVSPLPPGFEFPAGSIYDRNARPRRRGTARKTEVSEAALEEHDSHVPPPRGAHWQKSRKKRDALILGIGAFCVAAVVIVAFIPDKYLGIKREPVKPWEPSSPVVDPVKLDPSINSRDLLNSRPGPLVAREEKPVLVTEEERRAIVEKYLKEAERSREEVQAEMERLKEEMPGFVPPNRDPATAPVAPSTAPSTAIPAPTPVPAPAATPRRKKTPAEIDAEINRQTQETMQQLIRDKKIEPVPVAPPPAALPPGAAAPTAPAATPAVPPRATPVTR